MSDNPCENKGTYNTLRNVLSLIWSSVELVLHEYERKPNSGDYKCTETWTMMGSSGTDIMSKICKSRVCDIAILNMPVDSITSMNWYDSQNAPYSKVVVTVNMMPESKLN